MTSKKTSIIISIEFSDKEFPAIVLQSLEPENNQLDENSSVQMQQKDQELLIEYSSRSSLTTVRNTIDDILSTINTSENIYRTVKRNRDNQQSLQKRKKL